MTDSKSKTKPKRRLGRGISSLISADLAEHSVRRGGQQDHRTPGEGQAKPPTGPQGMIDSIPPGSAQLLLMPVDRIRLNPMQPRHQFDKAALSSLADSMKRCGTLQPIVIRRAGEGYELIAGERRLRAAKLAGITKIPAIVRFVSDDRILELAMIENLQRSDLNPVERARGYHLLQERYGLTHEQIAGRLGEDRATITNYIRLLGMSEVVLEMLERGELSAGHAKAIAGISDQDKQCSLARQVVKDGWSVRRTEAEATKTRKQPSRTLEQTPKRSAVSDIEDRLSAVLGVRVVIREGRRRHSGRVIISYRNLDDFQRVIQLLGIDMEGE